MKSFCPLLFHPLLCVLACAGVTQAQSPATPNSNSPFLPPLPYVQTLNVLPGRPLLLKDVTCTADSKPLTRGRLYLQDIGGGQVRVARVEYNEQGRYILEHGYNTPKVARPFELYVAQQKPFSRWTMNLLLGLWKAFGLHFSLEDVTYRCQLTAT